AAEIVLHVGWLLIGARRVIVHHGDFALSEMKDAALARVPAVAGAVSMELDVLDRSQPGGALRESHTRGGKKCTPLHGLQQWLQPELDLPSRARSGDAAEGPGIQGGVRIAEIGAVQDIEELRPELKGGALADPCILEHREIESLIANSGEHV